MGDASTFEQATVFAGRLAQAVGASLESLVYAPHPFAGGQLLVVGRDRLPSFREVLMAAHRSGLPPIPLHWLRVSELHLLSVPTVMDEYGGAVYWLRHRGRILWGSDVRSRIPLPADPGRLLAVVLTRALTWERNHLFLECAALGKYAQLLEGLASLARKLMATALLLFGEWEVDAAAILERFAARFREYGAEPLCHDLSALLDGTAAPIDPATDAVCLAGRAREGVWLLERLMRMLRSFAR